MPNAITVYPVLDRQKLDLYLTKVEDVAAKIGEKFTALYADINALIDSLSTEEIDFDISFETVKET